MQNRIISKSVIIISVFLVMFADGITTGKIVVLLSGFIMLSLAVLSKNRTAEYILTLLPSVCVLITGHERWKIYSCAGLFIMSAVLTMFTEEIQELDRKFIRQRDSDAELAMELQNRNRLLIENQDNEVHIATLNERNRIAREIHDNVGHMLSRALLMVGALRTVNTDESMCDGLEKLESTLDEAMTQVRRSVHDLHDEAIDLEENIREAASYLHNYETHIDYDCQSEVDRIIKLALIAICKEAVSNVIKHSSGNRVDIKLQEQTGFITLSVADNGKLYEEDRKKISLGEGSGIGLENMRERAESLGGHISFFTDSGFRVFVNLPKKGETADESTDCR